MAGGHDDDGGARDSGFQGEPLGVRCGNVGDKKNGGGKQLHRGFLFVVG